jgi:hypothetical protein
MRGWMVSLGLAGLVVAAAMVVQVLPRTVATSAEPAYDAASDPCFSYGRFECCVRSEER